jgi:hypothetical protein
MDRSQEKFHLQWHALQEVLDYHQSIIDENQNNEEKKNYKLRTHACYR